MLTLISMFLLDKHEIYSRRVLWVGMSFSTEEATNQTSGEYFINHLVLKCSRFGNLICPNCQYSRYFSDILHLSIVSHSASPHFD